MSTKTLEKLKKEIKQELLREFILPIVLSGIKDPEGEYRPEFVREVLEAAREPATHTFTNARDFLKQLRKKSR